ncbi:MAG: MauM/NapG family ferredoxin-type protein [Pseudomonadota bacterium]
MPDNVKGVSRRKALRAAEGVAGAVGAFGLTLAGYIKSATARASSASRPPGALPEEDFLSACVHCGLCVQDCPYDILKLATLEEPVATGTPFFIAREKACEMCEDIPCVKACPTGALDHDLVDIKKADMGLAAFLSPEMCYAVQGTSCRACYVACPVRDEAITMLPLRKGNQMVFQPTVHSAACTGCGMCEEACITPQASIKVLPRALASHDSGLYIHG